MTLDDKDTIFMKAILDDRGSKKWLNWIINSRFPYLRI